MSYASRVGDLHICPDHDTGPVQPPGATTVLINGKPSARAKDLCTCPNVPDIIVTGSSSVFIEKEMAARTSDRTMHSAGQLLVGSPNVFVGGATRGATLGAEDEGLRACATAANGRTSMSKQQTYGNCGLEASRQIINRSNRTNVSEESLLAREIAAGRADDSLDRTRKGGQSSEQTCETLRNNNVSVSTRRQTMDNIEQAVAERRGVISGHRTEILWNDGSSGGHVVCVTGIEYGPDGKAKTVIVNDTGRRTEDGNCAVHYRAEQYSRSLDDDVLIVTNDPVW